MSEKCVKPGHYFYSKFKEHKTSILWEIDNFNLKPGYQGQLLKSPTFYASDDVATIWTLRLHSDYPGETSINLHLEETNRDLISAKYRFELINNQKEIVQNITWQYNFRNVTDNKHEIYSNLEYFNNRLQKSTQNINIYFEITFSGETETISGRNESENSLLNDMISLFNSSETSDVVLIVEGKQFRAHKHILSARSPVFAAMFNTDMKENQNNEVIINDIKKDIFQEVLRFIYTGIAINTDIDSSAPLLSVADKYNLFALKSICEEYICSQLTVENVCDILVLADMHSAKQLKTTAINFIKNNSNQIMKTIGWKYIIESSVLFNFF